MAEPARDNEGSTRPGGRLPHAWLPDGRSTLDLIDPRVPTMLVCDGVVGPTGAPPSVVASCAAGVWTDAFGLDVDQCLIVRPDQHVAYRCPRSGVATAWIRLFGTRAGD